MAVFEGPGGIEERFTSLAALSATDTDAQGIVLEDGSFVAFRIPAVAEAEFGYFRNPDYLRATIVREPPEIIIGRPPAPSSTVRFLGKPPKGMEAGDWFAARSGAKITPLQVKGVRTEPDGFFIEFDREVSTPEATEFHGPMRQRLRPLNHDRDPRPFLSGGAVELEGISPEAEKMIRPRRRIFVASEIEGVARAEVTEIVRLAGGRLRLVLASKTDMSGWASGRTRFLINTVTVSHGETKGSQTLGSGDAERRRQSFAFDVKKISFVPSTAAEAGVAPDIDVSVNDVVWPYRDMIDPTAEDQQAWSYVLSEDGGLTIHFRQRLVTGFNNVKIRRHRVGVGLAGTGVPPFSFAKPMRKHRFVTAITQPFATEGGADREPASAIRESAPARLSANGRAVSLADFESLCRRHPSVWRARAFQVVGTGAAPRIRLVIVPAGGGGIAAVEDDLRVYLRARALPGVAFEFVPYESFPVSVGARIQIDYAAYDKTEVQEAAIAALTREFALEKRAIGQPFYIAEIMAALERVEGVSSTTVSSFGPAAGAPPTGGLGQARLAEIGGSVVAIHPADDQVAWLSALSITPEAI